MEYKINTTKQENEIIITNVTYTFDCGSQLTVDVAHYLPNSVEEIKLNIINRSTSELTKLNLVNNMGNLINEIPVNQTIQID